MKRTDSFLRVVVNLAGHQKLIKKLFEPIVLRFKSNIPMASFKLPTVRGTHARALDQFFTNAPLAKHCVQALQSCMLQPIQQTFGLVLEPSCGNGAFVQALASEAHLAPPQLCWMDIDSKLKQHRQDFLAYQPPSVISLPCLVVGNPPFGKNASKAVRFFNHAASFADVIAFVVPRSFRKASVQNRLNQRFHLVLDQVVLKSPEPAFWLQSVPYWVPCTFQVWMRATFQRQHCSLPSKGHVPLLRARIPTLHETDDFAFVKRDQNPDIAIRRVGVHAGRIFTNNLDTAGLGSHLFLRLRTPTASILQKLHSLDLEHAPCKYDTAGNPSLSKSELCALYLASK